MPLRPYQEQGVDFLAARTKAVLADEPGLGKSAQAIIAAERKGYRNLLVVCPAIGRVSWPIELHKWDLTERAVYHVGKDTNGVYKNPAVFIVSYDLLSRGGTHANHIADLARRGFFDLLILDEGQYLKDTGAKRTRFVYEQLVPRIGVTWVLSGTITPNHNGELYPHVRGLFPHVLARLLPLGPGGRYASRQEFEDEFCRVRTTTVGNGRQIVGNQHTDILRQALDPHLLRRRATELQAELPPLTIDEVEFDHDAIDNLLSPTQAHAVAAASLAFTEAYQEVQATGGGVDDDGIINSVDIPLSTVRRALGLAKVPLTAAWVEDLLVNGQDKVIVFAHHQDVVSSLAAALLDYSPVVITGATTTSDRVQRVKQFQEDPNTRVLCGNIQAAGTSVTLTASNRVVLAEPSWVPGDNEQAIRRSYRLGQKRPVVATYLSVKSSLDASINQTLARKSRDIARLLDEEKEPA